jgi:predicted ferric reductase
VRIGQFSEVFALSHKILAAALIVAVWFHAGSRTPGSVPTVYLLVASCTWLITRILWLCGVLYQNLRFGMPRAKIERCGSTLKVSIPVAWQRGIRPGQNVRLCTPTLSWCSILQWPHFAIAGYEHNDRGITIDFLIRERSRFTTALTRISHHPLALVDGPYGAEIPLKRYGTILLFASGIGIAAQLLYVKRVQDDYDDRETSCRELTLIWESDERFNDRNLIEPEITKFEAHEVSRFSSLSNSQWVVLSVAELVLTSH